MVSLDATGRPHHDAADAERPRAGSLSIGRALPPAVLAAVFLVALAARLIAHDVVITADEDNWMRRAGGFTWGLMNGQFGRTYQNGHPGVTTMWVAMLTLGPDRMVQYADRVHNQRLVGRVAGFWDALVDARPGFALATALLVTLIAGLTWRLCGPLAGALTGLVVGLEPFYLAISQLVHMDAVLSGCMVASVLAALVVWVRDGGRGWIVLSGVLAALAVLSKVPAVFLLPFVPALGGLVWLARRLPLTIPPGSPQDSRPAVPWAPCLPTAPRPPLPHAPLTPRPPLPHAPLTPQPPLPHPPLTPRPPLPHAGEGEEGSAPPHSIAMGRGTGGGTAHRLVVDLLIWGAVLAVTFVALWPAIWVHGPVEILGRVAAFTRETGGQPHEQGTFFWGRQTADPGPSFYPVAMAFRLAPVTLAGVLSALLSWRRLSPAQRLVALALAAYGCGFLLMMTLGAKKLDRYVLPIFPALGVLAALGLTAGYGWLRDRLTSTSPGAAAPAPSAPAPAARDRLTSASPGAAVTTVWKVAAAALLLVLTAWPAAAAYPYYLSYYNPLLGGGPAAQRTVMVGNGEGLDQVAAWLNAQPNASDLWVVSHSFDILQALIVASGEPLRDRVPSNADYVVLYRFQIQIGHSPRVLDEYLNRRVPEHVVWIDGIEYARVYRGPHRLSERQPPAHPGARGASSDAGLAEPLDEASTPEVSSSLRGTADDEGGSLSPLARAQGRWDHGDVGTADIRAPQGPWDRRSGVLWTPRRDGEGPGVRALAIGADAMPAAAPSAHTGSQIVGSPVPGWEEQVKPRLRRLRTAATRLVPNSTETAP